MVYRLPYTQSSTDKPHYQGLLRLVIVNVSSIEEFSERVDCR